MADELNQKENLSQSPSVARVGGKPPEDESSSEGESLGGQGRVAELEGLVAQKDEQLARVNARLIELEQTLAVRDGELVTLKQSHQELEAGLTTLNHSLAEAVASYKTMVVQVNPGVIEELVTGDTIESVNESLSKAKILISKVRQGVEDEILLTKVPAGAPERTLPDFSALSSREKIQYAIARQVR